MRKLKKFKRYAEGGALGAGEGDPFSYTDFSNRERNLRKPSEAAPIEERKPSEPAKETKAEKEDTKPVKAPPPSGRREIPPIPLTDEEKRADSDKGAAPSSFTTTGNAKKAEEYRRSLMADTKPAASSASKSAKDPRDMEKGNSRGSGSYPINISTGASGFGKSSTSSAAPAKPKAASPDEIPGTDVKTPYTGEKIDNSNLPAKQFAQSTLGATAAGRTLGAGVRGAMGLGRMFESAVKPEGKGTGKFPEAKPEIEVSSKPAVDRLKEANIQGPPKPPRQETPAEKMGLRETSTVEKSRKANEVGPPDLGARARRVAEDAAKDTKQGEEVMAAANRRAQQTRAEYKQADDVMAAANKRARQTRAEYKQADDVMVAANRRARENRAAQRQSADDEVTAEAAKRAAASKPKSETKPKPETKSKSETKSKPRKVSKPAKEESPAVDKKRGGKIPAFKKGGLVGRGDGCAQRGKTKGRMV